MHLLTGSSTGLAQAATWTQDDIPGSTETPESGAPSSPQDPFAIGDKFGLSVGGTSNGVVALGAAWETRLPSDVDQSFGSCNTHLDCGGRKPVCREGTCIACTTDAGGATSDAEAECPLPFGGGRCITDSANPNLGACEASQAGWVGLGRFTDVGGVALDTGADYFAEVHDDLFYPKRLREDAFLGSSLTSPRPAFRPARAEPPRYSGGVSIVTTSARLLLPTRRIWPAFKGGASRLGRSSVAGTRVGARAWSVSLGDDVESSPAIGGDGTIYVGTENDALAALSPSGTVLWEFAVGGDVDSSPALGTRGEIYFGSDDGRVYAVAADGSALWSFQTDGRVDSSPVVATDGTVYVGSDDGTLYALNADGTLAWSYHAGAAIDSSPALGADGAVVFGTNHGLLVNLGPDGSVRWRRTIFAPIDATPAVSPDGAIYVGDDWGRLSSWSPDGHLKWVYRTYGAIDSSPSVSLDGTIVFGSDDGRLHAVMPNGDRRWVYRVWGRIDSTPVIDNTGAIFFGDDWGRLHCVSLSTGKRVWRRWTGGSIDSSPAIGLDGTVYVGSDDNHIHAFR